MISSWVKTFLFIFISSHSLVHAQLIERAARHCIPLTQGKNLFLRWDEKDQYSRTIKYYESSSSCSDWGILKRRKFLFSDLTQNLKAQYKFRAQTLEELRQIENGAEIVILPRRPEALVYLESHPISHFTIENNRELTRKFGHGYASEIYRAWVESQPQNQIAQYTLESSFKNLKPLSQNERNEYLNRLNSHQAILLIALGLNWEEQLEKDTKDYIGAFFTVLQTLGIPHIILHRERYGSLEENTQMIEPQIRKLLSQGQDLVLYGLCKGAPEILAATARVVGPYLDSDRKQTHLPRGWGRIAGGFFSSPMISGTIFARGTEYFSESFHQMKLLFDFIRFDDVAGTLHVLPSIAPSSLSDWMKPIYSKLPSDIRYLTTIGVIGGNGLLQNDTTGMDFFISLARNYGLANASHDGFIEYPGTELPYSLSPETHTIVVHSSHMIMDGDWNGVSLRSKDAKHAAYTSFLSYVLSNPIH